MLNKLAGVALRTARHLMRRDENRVVVLPSAMAGSLGDQAMLDAICGFVQDELGKSAVIVTHRKDNIKVNRDVERIFLDDSGMLGKLGIVRKLFGSGSLLFLGADVADGYYGGDCGRLALVDLAARSGMKTAILGFSFSESPGDKAVKRLRNLPPVLFHLRDPVSAERFENVVGKSAIRVADSAFLLKPDAKSAEITRAIEWARKMKSGGHTVLGVNLSGTTISGFGDSPVSAMAKCLGDWLDLDPKHSLMLIPHDYRAPPVGDVELLSAIWNRLSPGYGDRLHLVSFPFNAWDIKALAPELDFVVVARMHFAIACLGMGTPPLCITYAGKFEGLMQHFGLEDMLLSPNDIKDSDALLARLVAFQSRIPELQSQIDARLPAVIDLSRQNFGWLQP